MLYTRVYDAWYQGTMHRWCAYTKIPAMYTNVPAENNCILKIIFYAIKGTKTFKAQNSFAYP